ncbi:carboxylate-amine ligase [Streptomyces morookaense]|uniref:Putative glutamate--cysteine ligase 2 n=1 Tax=Streptomyces morookaense TaxID=1970 RepID=A0A7Y7E5A3_STRMO|nr:glutamate--cysteine ligase [Streptomyces morookaense]NVK76545.1 glutamate--cysteine ligase [Streptomyces morookaense]GHF07874.1 putative glutamate--cysteine ligase 2 [Streptomyces morookaense]
MTSELENELERKGTPDPPTIGLEEEFFLADRETRATVGRAPDVVKRARQCLGDQAGFELYPTIVETRTRPVGTLAELRQQLQWLRAGLGRAAAEAGCRVVASGTEIIPVTGPQPIVDDPRYWQLADRYPQFVGGDRSIASCACHIHIHAPDREEAVELLNHLRPWLPTLQAIAANSPFRDGRDSGFASWRSLHFGQWPHVGPTPLLRDTAAYDSLLDALVESGMLFDRRHLYWYARLSERWPTLEIRLPDINADLDTVLFVACLARALVGVLLADVRRGAPAPGISDPLLRAAHWRAARDGVRGSGLDLFTGRLRPFPDLAVRLIDRVAPALEETGALHFVRHTWQRLHASGGGAEEQRAAYRRRGDLRDVVDLLTVAGGSGESEADAPSP